MLERAQNLYDNQSQICNQCNQKQSSNHIAEPFQQRPHCSSTRHGHSNSHHYLKHQTPKNLSLPSENYMPVQPFSLENLFGVVLALPPHIALFQSFAWIHVISRAEVTWLQLRCLPWRGYQKIVKIKANTYYGEIPTTDLFLA